MKTLVQVWEEAWPTALSVWSKYTRLSPPTLCTQTFAARAEGLEGSFAMIRFVDLRIVIDLELVRTYRLQEYAVEILAHEIGHHILAPANPADNLHLVARMRKALPTLERHVPMLANLYTDLLINDRLQRQHGLRMAEIYIAMIAKSGITKSKSASLWSMYMRIYEYLWQLEKGSLCGEMLDPRAETDAWLGSRVVRVYARDWLSGAGRFAALMLPYILEEDTFQKDLFKGLSDLNGANDGSAIRGILEIDPDEISGAIHPAEDPLITGEDNGNEGTDEVFPVDTNEATLQAHGQMREPFEYGEILKAAGLTMSDHDIAIQYYRERALPYLLPYPRLPAPDISDSLPEGLDVWGMGDPIDEIDYLQSLVQSPILIPGLSTVKRLYGTQSGPHHLSRAIDLDIYVDSSGSMPNPQVSTSWLTLAGTIIALSALRAGARVKVTLWSGKNDVTETAGFVRDEQSICAVLTGFYGGNTCFPIHCLRKTYPANATREHPAHILMISDDGITTMFNADEKGVSGWTITEQALRLAGGGGTLALNLPEDFDSSPYRTNEMACIEKACATQDWVLYRITDWEQLMTFARDFARRHRDGLVLPAKGRRTK